MGLTAEDWAGGALPVLVAFPEAEADAEAEAEAEMEAETEAETEEADAGIEMEADAEPEVATELNTDEAGGLILETALALAVLVDAATLLETAVADALEAARCTELVVIGCSSARRPLPDVEILRPLYEKVV